MSAGTIPVVVVEDDRVHMKFLVDAVQGVPGVVLASQCRRADEFRALLGDTAGPVPSLVLMDLGLPDGAGADLTREAREKWPEVRVLAVSEHSDERHVVEALQSGACGYVVKDGDVPQLTYAVREVLAGQHPISPSVARHLIAFVTGQKRYSAPGKEAPELTRREFDILYKMADGLSYAEAAEALEISRATVESHIRRLYRKLEVHSKTQALLRARQHGLI